MGHAVTEIHHEVRKYCVAMLDAGGGCVFGKTPDTQDIS